MRRLAGIVARSRHANGVPRARRPSVRQAIRPDLYAAIQAIRRARDAARERDFTRCEIELKNAEDAIQWARLEVLTPLAQIGGRSAGATNVQQDRAEELREWLRAARPTARNVRELRALPGFPAAAARLSDTTVRKCARDSGLRLTGGRPKKT